MHEALKQTTARYKSTYGFCQRISCFHWSQGRSYWREGS